MCKVCSLPREWQTCAYYQALLRLASSLKGTTVGSVSPASGVQDAGNSEGISFLDNFQDPMLRKPHGAPTVHNHASFFKVSLPCFMSLYKVAGQPLGSCNAAWIGAAHKA